MRSMKGHISKARFHFATIPGAVAEKRAELAGALVVLGSATLSVESYHRAIAGTYRLVSLPERVEQRPLPKVELVDMRAEFEAGTAAC